MAALTLGLLSGLGSSRDNTNAVAPKTNKLEQHFLSWFYILEIFCILLYILSLLISKSTIYTGTVKKVFLNYHSAFSFLANNIIG